MGGVLGGFALAAMVGVATVAPSRATMRRRRAAVLAGVLAVTLGLAGASPASAAAPAYTYGAVTCVYNGPAQLSSPDAGATDVRGSSAGREGGSRVQMANGLSREIDVDLGDLIVQVKSGNARGLTGQLQDMTATTGRTAIGYAPDIPNGAWEAAVRQGVPIARTPDELVAIVKELGG